MKAAKAAKRTPVGIDTPTATAVEVWSGGSGCATPGREVALALAPTETDSLYESTSERVSRSGKKTGGTILVPEGTCPELEVESGAEIELEGVLDSMTKEKVLTEAGLIMFVGKVELVAVSVAKVPVDKPLPVLEIEEVATRDSDIMVESKTNGMLDEHGTSEAVFIRLNLEEDSVVVVNTDFGSITGSRKPTVNAKTGNGEEVVVNGLSSRFGIVCET